MSTEEFLPSTSCTRSRSEGPLQSVLVSTQLQSSLDAAANALVANAQWKGSTGDAIGFNQRWSKTPNGGKKKNCWRKRRDEETLEEEETKWYCCTLWDVRKFYNLAPKKYRTTNLNRGSRVSNLRRWRSRGVDLLFSLLGRFSFILSQR